jgi:putative DNA methylase
VVVLKKKLIEVALPLEAINRESAREKSIRHGHPSTLHLWWARRPLAACRAVLFASLVDDPSAHPDRFPTEEAQQEERERLFRIIEDLVKWENSTNTDVLKAARAEIMASCDGSPPPVLDPFCGGGSIPLEAQRLGLEAHASDLNPVAVLITKALIEIPPKFAGRPPVHPDDGSSKDLGSWEGARGLAEDVRYYGRWMRDEAERRIGHLYPKVELPPEHGGGEATVIAWIWARTVKSPNPAWDGPMPLVRSFALSTKKGKETWVQPIVDREQRRIRFEIRTGPGCPEGTVGRNGAVCLATGTPVPLNYIRAEGKAGRMGAQLMAIVAEGSRGRIYLPPDDTHQRIAASAEPPWMPEEKVPTPSHDVDRLPMYGMTRWGDAFTKRQLVALCQFSELVVEARERVRADAAGAGWLVDGTRLVQDGTGSDGYADAVATYLAFAVDRLADRSSTVCSWDSSPKMEAPRNTFARQAIPMSWDYAEGNVFSESSGNFGGATKWIGKVIERLPASRPGHAVQLDASMVTSEQSVVVATDPPYYDNIGYSDLSDFFYVWLRRSLRNVWPRECSTLVTPKTQELIASPYRFDGNRRTAEEYFETGLSAVFERMRKIQAVSYPLTLIYAFRQSESDDEVDQIASTGWETMLEGLLRSGLSVHGTWPIRSELSNRMLASGTNALASSIALACRPRSQGAPLATRKDFVAALKAELPTGLKCLQQGNIAPVDLAQASIGPGMAVFSRYSKVIEADGKPMRVRTALGLINHVLDETLAEQEADFDAETRWALAWFEQHGMNPGPFGMAEILSKAKNTAVNGLVNAGIVVSKAGRVRLLDRNELQMGWNPATDTRLTVWEVAQHLIRALDTGGETKAAELLYQVGGGLAETARELAYRLYTFCERKKWAKEALAYNALVVSWPEIVRLASEGSTEASGQQTLV